MTSRSVRTGRLSSSRTSNQSRMLKMFVRISNPVTKGKEHTELASSNNNDMS